MSRVLPILFNTEMVRAIPDDRKTVTRRLVKFPKYIQEQENGLYTLFTEGTCYEDQHFEQIVDYLKKPYQPGDILYVRETWRVGAWDIRNQMIAFDYKDGTCEKLTYINDRELFVRLVSQSREDARKAGCEYNGADFVWEKGKSPCRWHPSIHMPKEAARIWLKVTDVRVERLQEITVNDCVNEGAYWIPKNPEFIIRDSVKHAAIKEFSKLWESTIKKSDLDRYGWAANPWVWVIEFERCGKPEKL